MKGMESVIPILMIGAMLATLGVVMVGIISFAVYGNFYRRNSNRLMRMRVAFQALALGIFALLMLAVAG